MIRARRLRGGVRARSLSLGLSITVALLVPGLATGHSTPHQWWRPPARPTWLRRWNRRLTAGDRQRGIMGVLYDLALDGRRYRPCWIASL